MGSRSVGLGIALVAALAAGAPARAATITYDLATGSELRLRSSFEAAGYAAIPFVAGSSLTLELDANGDGAPGDVTVASSQLHAQGSVDFGVLGSLEIDALAVLAGGLGSVAGDETLWTAPASYSISGTLRCSGPVCDVAGMTPGAPYPYETIYPLSFSGPTVIVTVPFDEILLGTWLVTPDGFGAAAQIAVAGDAATREWTQALALAGREVPEPSPAALLPLVGLALGARRRWRGLIVSLALLGTAAASSAATLTYDMSGTSTFRRASAFAPNGLGYVETPLAPGSTLTLEFDTNGDGRANDATVAASTLLVNESLTTFAGTQYEFTLATDLVLELSGGLGVLYAADPVFWLYAGIEWLQPVSQSLSGTLRCFGPACASLVGLVDGQEYDYASLAPRLFGGVPIPSLVPGIWNFPFTPANTIQGSCVDHWDYGCNDTIPSESQPATGMWVSGVRLRGTAVAEPGSSLLGACTMLALLRRLFA